jgi:hypothetical protein
MTGSYHLTATHVLMSTAAWQLPARLPAHHQQFFATINRFNSGSFPFN